MARAVSIAEFTEWLSKNEHRTWKRGLKDKTLEIKYFYTSLDTRTMEIFFIGTDRKDRVWGSHMDAAPTVLAALESRLNGEEVKPLDLFSTYKTPDKEPSDG